MSNLVLNNFLKPSDIATDQDILDKTAGALIDASRVAPDDIIAVDSDVTLPTVNAVKNLVSNATAGGVTYRGSISVPATFNGTTSNNYLNNTTDVETGDMFVAIGSGNLTMADGDIFVANGDALIINTSNPKNAITKAMIDDISPTYPSIEIGDNKYSWVANNHDGWLLEDGSEISRTDYPLLFSLIGTSQGAGDGSTTFNLPDSRGRVTGGAGQGVGLTNRVIGEKFGEERTTLTELQMPSHNHNYTYQYKLQTAPYGDNDRTVWEYVEDRTRTTTSAGGGQSHNNLQPSIAKNIFIYAGV